MGIPLQEEHRVPIRHRPIDLIVFVRQDSVAFSKSKWFFALCNTVVINWLNKQMNDQMMSQQRLGPFEMHTKPVSTRGPPLVPYNKVCQIILFAFFCFCFFKSSSAASSSTLLLLFLLLLLLLLHIIIIDIVIIIITINIAMIVLLSLSISLLLLGDEHNRKLHHLSGKQNGHSTFLGASSGRFILLLSLLKHRLSGLVRVNLCLE